MKDVVLVSTSKCIENGTNFFATIPATVRSILKPEKGDKVEWIIYSDKTIEIKIVKGE